ncbi:tRNA 4-thiouridine(8) synthase ThiI [Salipaludibacillus agaradhaerens]|uniref:tRNA uracil 4-sulfurtransferase ThiI n=1 Tax=Salipaludibacillus agaradhaerens TaxID=76935 RepID=UPI0021513AA0|nr:tRNA uracil 4-sulfurtransferase ThiI [Salipaludibacillus agaradhaerens]MCR6107598.1 tRNA 4-thiouridine(8) synthase ThiI [Salipaludibacillus agaradhaerens]MCR6119627.1 tRNA 4-thiouridine(8) synthase ThiI [Salipaludibacillus agaradhaerens]UJW58639.1 tRNA 4-thiouridine(8) synthase ThiI [Bacillus sp. A116_S68]
MKYDHILIRYAELSLKGKNRKQFEQKLERNIREVLKGFEAIKVKRSFGRMFVKLNGEEETAVCQKLQTVFGIHSLSPSIKIALSEKEISEGALWAAEDALPSGRGTFKVSVRRTNKDFPIGSQEMNKVIGGHILRNMNEISVDVHNPDVELKVEIRSEAAYISSKVLKGAGGLPVGTSGKVLLMLSGGIDSPVAGYLALKRGVTLEAIHFHSPPFTNERAKQKVEDLVKVLTQFGGTIKLHIVPFTDVQTLIHKQVPDNYEMTVTRRFMLRIAEKIAKVNHAKAIVNGESLGQVASQTLDSMYTINSVTNLPVLRPLITMDKLEVIEQARKIGTYEISILPYEDCCTIFLPAESKTKPDKDKAERYESFLNLEEIIDDAVNRTTSHEFTASADEESEINELF